MREKLRMRLVLILSSLVCASTAAVAANSAHERPKSQSCIKKEKSEWRAIWRDCLKFHSPERIRGVWYAVWEEQGFVEGSNEARTEIDNDANAPEYETRLDLDTVAAMKMAGQPAWAPCVRAVAIDFIGRRPAEDLTKFGYAPKKLIVVDKLLSAKFLGQVKERGVPEKDQDCSRKAADVEP